MRWLCPLFTVLVACSSTNAVSLERPDVRVALGNELLQTLDQQEHYFETQTARAEFSTRLDGIAERTGNADSYYRALSDALATLGEGHTGLVGSAIVPFSETIPPIAILEVDSQFVVAGVAPGVEGGGLRPGDVILDVDGIPAPKALLDRVEVTPGSTVHGQRARAVATLLAGPTNAPVRARVRGIDGKERMCFPLRFLLEDSGIDRFRFGFLAERVTARRVSPSCLYISLPDFHPDRRAEMEEALEMLGGLPVCVLDLRGNPGGRIRTLQRVAGLFLDAPEVLLKMYEGEREELVKARPAGRAYRGQLKILIDERTGSAAELLAAALRDIGRAELLGRATAGSTRSRQSSVLPGGVVFHYAGQTEFRRRDGGRVEGEGVSPDVIYHPSREALAEGLYGDPYRDPLVRLAQRSRGRPQPTAIDANPH